VALQEKRLAADVPPKRTSTALRGR
jgi:hypothetical protein